MELAERETVICLNRADMAEGYFCLWTSERSVFDRLCRRIGGRDKLLACRPGIRGGKEGSWDCQVPIEFWHSATFAIGRKRRARELTPEQRAMSSERLRRLRKARFSDQDSESGESDQKSDLEAVPAVVGAK